MGEEAAERRRVAAPPRWLTLAATLCFGALHLCNQRGATGQVYDWNGISVKQYEAQLSYERWQKDDETYSEWAYRNGYLECSDDMQGTLAAVNNGVYTCDALVALMECSTDISEGLIPSLPANTTVADLCPLSCNSCIEPGFVYDDLAVVYSTSLCAMCAQGGDSTFGWMKHPHCRDYKSKRTGNACFPKWEVGCPRQCAQWFDRRMVTRTPKGGILWSYLTEDGRWYIMDVDLCAALERWEFPVIDAKRLDVRLSQLCRDPNRDEFLFQGVVIDWPDFSRLHFEFRRQSQLAYEDKEAAYMEALMTAQSAAALQANLDALNNGR